MDAREYAPAPAWRAPVVVALVGAALLAACWVAGDTALRLVRLQCGYGLAARVAGDAAPARKPAFRWRDLTCGLSQTDDVSALSFVMGGDPAFGHPVEGSLAVWRAYPRQPAWYAQHVYRLLQAGTPPAEMERALREGTRVDPGNALYRYLLAELYFSRSISVDAAYAVDEETAQHPLALRTVTDRAKFAQGVAALQAALASPRYRGYHLALMQEKVRRLPPASTMEDHLLRFALVSGEEFPELQRLRTVMRHAPFAAHELARAGRMREATALLEGWKPMLRHLAAEPDALIQLLVAGAQAGVSVRQGAAVYRALGQPAQAARMEAEGQRALQAFHAWKDGRTDAQRAADTDWARKHGGTLAGIYLPVFRATDVQLPELASVRALDYLKIEQIFLIALILVLAALLVHALLVGWRWRIALHRAGEAPPPLGWPSTRAWVAIGGWVCGLPAVWVVYTHRTEWAWGDRHVLFALDSFALPLLALWWLLLLLPTSLTGRDMRRSWEVAGRDVPRPSGWAVFGRGVLRVLWVPVFLYMGASVVSVWWRGGVSGQYRLAIPLGLLVCAVCGACVVLPGVLRRSTAGAAFYAVRVSARVPVYAALLLFLALLILPLTRVEERRLLRADTLMFFQDQPYAGFTPLESRVCRALARGFREGLAAPAPAPRLSDHK